MKASFGSLGLFVIMAVIMVFGIIAFYFSSDAFADDNLCHRLTIDRMNNWITKMSQSTVQPFTSELEIRSCIEHVETDGIKFKDNEEVTVFKNLNGIDIRFDTGGLGKIPPSSEPYRVMINPPDVIEFLPSDDQ